MFHVRWKPANVTCAVCNGSGRHHYAREPAEVECRACEGKGTIYLSDVAAQQAKLRKKLLGQLRKDGFEPVGMDANEFELWERKARAEDSRQRVRRNQPAPVLYADTPFAAIAAHVADLQGRI